MAIAVKVLGPGCTNCERLAAAVREAAERAGVDVDIVKVTDFAEIMKYGVMSTPALVVNEELKLAGRVASAEEVAKILAAAAAG